MLKRHIKYRDLDGNPVEGDFYFHYSIGEAVEMKISLGDDLQAKIAALIAAKKPADVIAIFKDIVAGAVGLKSESGRSFIKNTDIREEFLGSDAYSEMLIWLLSDTNNMNAFVNGIFPSNMAERVEALVKEREAAEKTTTVDIKEVKAIATPNLSIVPTPQKKFSDYTQAELLAMPADEFAKLKSGL